jgi:hypothetical protein
MCVEAVYNAFEIAMMPEIDYLFHSVVGRVDSKRALGDLDSSSNGAFQTVHGDAFAQRIVSIIR